MTKTKICSDREVSESITVSPWDTSPWYDRNLVMPKCQWQMTRWESTVWWQPTPVLQSDSWPDEDLSLFTSRVSNYVRCADWIMFGTYYSQQEYRGFITLRSHLTSTSRSTRLETLPHTCSLTGRCSCSCNKKTRTSTSTSKRPETY